MDKYGRTDAPKDGTIVSLLIDCHTGLYLFFFHHYMSEQNLLQSTEKSLLVENENLKNCMKICLKKNNNTKLSLSEVQLNE